MASGFRFSQSQTVSCRRPCSQPVSAVSGPSFPAWTLGFQDGSVKQEGLGAVKAKVLASGPS